jgi:hypothetical protein
MGLQIEEENRSIIYIDPLIRDTASIAMSRIAWDSVDGHYRIPSKVDGKPSRR